MVHSKGHTDYALTLPEPPQAGVSARAGDDPFRGGRPAEQALCAFARPGRNESVGKPIKFRILLPRTRLEHAEVYQT